MSISQEVVGKPRAGLRRTGYRGQLARAQVHTGKRPGSCGFRTHLVSQRTAGILPPALQSPRGAKSPESFS